MATLWGDEFDGTGNLFMLEAPSFVLRGAESLVNYLQIKFNELMYTRLQVGFGGNAGSGSTTAAR